MDMGARSLVLTFEVVLLLWFIEKRFDIRGIVCFCAFEEIP